jgi:hypothetical protein
MKYCERVMVSADSFLERESEHLRRIGDRGDKGNPKMRLPIHITVVFTPVCEV